MTGLQIGNTCARWGTAVHQVDHQYCCCQWFGEQRSSLRGAEELKRDREFFVSLSCNTILIGYIMI